MIVAVSERRDKRKWEANAVRPFMRDPFFLKMEPRIAVGTVITPSPRLGQQSRGVITATSANCALAVCLTSAVAGSAEAPEETLNGEVGGTVIQSSDQSSVG